MLTLESLLCQADFVGSFKLSLSDELINDYGC